MTYELSSFNVIPEFKRGIVVYILLGLASSARNPNNPRLVLSSEGDAIPTCSEKDAIGSKGGAEH